MHSILQERPDQSGVFDKVAEFNLSAVGYYKGWDDALAKAIEQDRVVRTGRVVGLGGALDPAEPLAPGRYLIQSGAGVAQLVELFNVPRVELHVRTA